MTTNDAAAKQREREREREIEIDLCVSPAFGDAEKKIAIHLIVTTACNQS